MSIFLPAGENRLLGHCRGDRQQEIVRGQRRRHPRRPMFAAPVGRAPGDEALCGSCFGERGRGQCERETHTLAKLQLCSPSICPPSPSNKLLQDLRLSQLGLSAEQADRALNIPGYTRCLGYHDAKGGYTDVDALRDFSK